MFTDSEIRDAIRDAAWRFATSMPEHPHEYVVRGETMNDPLFSAFVQHIRMLGVRRHWKFGKHYIYFELDGYQYWTMGRPIEQTKIINRTKTK